MFVPRRSACEAADFETGGFESGGLERGLMECEMPPAGPEVQAESCDGRSTAGATGRPMPCIESRWRTAPAGKIARSKRPLPRSPQSAGRDGAIENRYP